MSKHAEEKKPTTWWDEWAPLTITVALCLIFAGVVTIVETWSHFFGATAEQVLAVNLAQTPKQLGKALPSTKVRDDRVEVAFRHTVLGFESARFDWRESPNHVSGIRLTPEREKESKKKEGSGSASAAQRLAGYFPGITARSSDWEWGSVRFSGAEDGELSFRVSSTDKQSHAPNPRFEDQVDAARQVLFDAAFGIQPTRTKKELADLVGVGYALADVGTIDITAPRTALIAAVRANFPGTLVDKYGARIALDHPVFYTIKINFDGTLEFNDVTDLSKKREALANCIGGNAQVKPSARGISRLGFDGVNGHGVTLSIDVRMSGAMYETGGDTASFAKMLRALDACRVF